MSLILALDTPDKKKIDSLLIELQDHLSWIKIGFQALSILGFDSLKSLKERYGYNIFLDLKFYDIPSTVGRNVVTAAQIGADMISIQSTGDRTNMGMLWEAREQINNFATTEGIDPPLLIASTVLTSISYFSVDRALGEVAVCTGDALDCGLDGVIMSPHEVMEMRKEFGNDFLIVTPGIRPEGISSNDQKRHAMPAQAVKAGANYLVIGRPILNAEDPVEMVRSIKKEMDLTKASE